MKRLILFLNGVIIIKCKVTNDGLSYNHSHPQENVDWAEE